MCGNAGAVVVVVADPGAQRVCPQQFRAAAADDDGTAVVPDIAMFFRPFALPPLLISPFPFSPFQHYT